VPHVVKHADEFVEQRLRGPHLRALTGNPRNPFAGFNLVHNCPNPQISLGIKVWSPPQARRGNPGKECRLFNSLLLRQEGKYDDIYGGEHEKEYRTCPAMPHCSSKEAVQQRLSPRNHYPLDLIYIA
jgi:hypothetical protein